MSNPSPAIQPGLTLTSTVTLTPEQIAFYHREGYLALPAISTPEEVAWMREIYDRLFETRAGRETGDQFDLAGADEEGKKAALPQILGPAKYAPELKAGLFRVNAMSIARQLLGPEAVAHGDHAILKPPRHGAPTPWHQDEAYWSGNQDYHSFSMWMPLQPAVPENGCMQFVPRSHTGEIVEHRSIGNDPRVHGLETDHVDASKGVLCPIPAGGCTIHHNRTLHYAGPNLSDMPRRAFIMIFGIPPTPAASPRDYFWNTQKTTARDARAKAAAEVKPETKTV